MSEEINKDPYQDMVEGKDQDIMDQVKQNGLGKASMARFTNDVQDADRHLGWVSLSVDELPSEGMFYPEDAIIKIKAATVAEIRHFSTIDETNLIDIDEKLNYIVRSCIQVSSKTKKFAPKDILEEDRFYILLAVRDLTFPEPENTLRVTHEDQGGKKHDIEIKREYFQFFKIKEDLQKYYDDEKRTFSIQTKSYGTIEMRPPSIGIMEEVTKYIKERQARGQNIDQSLLQVMPFIITDWRSFNSKTLFNLEVEMNGWDHKKYSLIYKLAEQMKVGIKPMMRVDLGDVVEEVPIGFRDGLKSMFIIQDIAGELL